MVGGPTAVDVLGHGAAQQTHAGSRRRRFPRAAPSRRSACSTKWLNFSAPHSIYAVNRVKKPLYFLSYLVDMREGA